MKRNRKTRSLLTMAVLLALGPMTSDPADAVVQQDAALEFHGTYVSVVEPAGTIEINPEPDVLKAPWRLESDAGAAYSGNGDSVLRELPVAMYTVIWEIAPGWSEPVSETVSLTADQVLTLTGVYTEIPDGGGAGIPRIPAPDEWTDHGEIFRGGVDGDWDLYFWGGFAATAVKRDGVYFLYYQGADGYDEVEATVTRRTVGVATSADGINFEKYFGNPVVSWFPTDGSEEGAASAGAWVSQGGDVNLYYGANTATSASLVSTDGRIASSGDGYTFVDGGLALDHSDPAIWGYGDELFPLVGFNAGDNWFCYYVPNGTAQRGSLGVAWGNAETRLSNSSQCRSEGSAVPVWGPGGWARLSPSSYAIFVSSGADAHADGNHTDVYRVDPASPASFTGPVESYQFPNATKSTVLLDLESMTWFLYYRKADPSAYGVRTAPVILE